MFPGFTSFDLEVETNVTIHGVKAGTGPPLLLLHGFPQSHIMWHLTAPQLSTSHTVIAMDLRGYGASSKLPVSASHAAYAKSAMARDCVAVMSHFNFPTFSVLAHDRGARVAHKLAVDHPTCVVKVMLLDIAPTLAMYEQTSQGFATAYFHWFFLIQANPFPENAILQAGDAWARMAVGKPPYGEANVSYVESFKDEATVTGVSLFHFYYFVRADNLLSVGSPALSCWWQLIPKFRSGVRITAQERRLTWRKLERILGGEERSRLRCGYFGEGKASLASSLIR
jgi:haloacetate dehalogenase